MRRRGCSRAWPLAAVLAATLAIAPAAFPEGAAAPAPQVPASPAQKTPADKPAGLKEAQARLAAASSPSEYASLLDSFSTSLPPTDALALLDKGIPGAGQEYRKAFLVKAGDLDLLLGLFGEAQVRYEAAASAQAELKPEGKAEAPQSAKDPALLLRSARCAIAAGDTEKAAALAADILSAGDAELAAAARLVEAWALLMQDRPEDASAIASAIAGAPKSGPGGAQADRRREARFIMWLSAPSEGKASAKAEAAAKLASEFPGSPEALIASGAASAPPLPHWYLGGLGSARPESPKPAAAPQPAQPLTPSAIPAEESASSPASSAAPSAASPSPAAQPPAQAAEASSAAPAAGAAAQAPSPASKGKRLQVGYFSREDNAQALKSELSAKGFSAAIELRFRAASAGKAAEKRWIVVVEGGKDPAAVRQALKDSGYESYIVD